MSNKILIGNIKGQKGDTGATGRGVPAGGIAGQILKKASDTNFDTEWADETGNGEAINTSATIVLFPSENDHANITDAIASLPSGGGKIVLREGTYNITGTIQVGKDNVTIEGSRGAAKLVFDHNEASNIKLNNRSNCKIANLHISGNSSATNKNGIELSFCNNCVVTGNIIDINNSGNTQGICLNHGLGNIVTGNTCNNTCGNNNGTSAGIFINSFYTTVSGNLCGNSGGNGGCAGIQINSTGNTISENKIYSFNSGGSCGIVVTNMNNTIIGNIVENSCQNYETALVCFGISVSGNNTENCAVIGNRIGNDCQTDITGKCYGIYLTDCGNCTVNGNACRNTGTCLCYGIGLNYTENTAVTGNVLKNTAYGANSHGIALEGAACATVSGNLCGNSSANAMSYGIKIESCQYTAVNGNSVSNKRESGQSASNTFALWIMAGGCNMVHSNNLTGVTKADSAGAAFTANGTASATMTGTAGSQAALNTTGSMGFNLV